MWELFLGYDNYSAQLCTYIHNLYIYNYHYIEALLAGNSVHHRMGRLRSKCQKRQSVRRW